MRFIKTFNIALFAASASAAAVEDILQNQQQKCEDAFVQLAQVKSAFEIMDSEWSGEAKEAVYTVIDQFDEDVDNIKKLCAQMEQSLKSYSSELADLEDLLG